MFNFNAFDKIIKNAPVIAIMTAISSDPNPPQVWVNLINNMFVRFLFIYVLVYEATQDMNMSLNISIGIILFFYTIASKQEKQNYIDSVNFNFQELNIFKNIFN